MSTNPDNGSGIPVNKPGLAEVACEDIAQPAYFPAQSKGTLTRVIDQSFLNIIII